MMFMVVGLCKSNVTSFSNKRSINLVQVWFAIYLIKYNKSQRHWIYYNIKYRNELWDKAYRENTWLELSGA